MKKLNVQTALFICYEQRFKTWLKIIDMGKTAQHNMPLHIRELLYYMEQKQIQSIEQISDKMMIKYIQYLNQRQHQRRAGGLSTGYINKHIQAIKKFQEYLWLNHQIKLSTNIRRLETKDKKHIEVLSQKEIHSMYVAAELDELLCLRDKAILDVFYGCGLRRTEGERLDIQDVDIALRRIHVRHGKNYTQRYVPFTKPTALSLNSYIEDCRIWLIDEKHNRAFFIGLKGKRLKGISILSRIKKLQERSTEKSIKAKSIGLHTLRHSIATHLLQEGLELKQIAKFLGHKSIESTQIYTHLINGIVNQSVNKSIK